jgi:hypothetical protein
MMMVGEELWPAALGATHSCAAALRVRVTVIASPPARVLILKLPSSLYDSTTCDQRPTLSS